MALGMANVDLYTTIRLGPDPNRMGHNIRGRFDPMHHACFRAIDISSVFDRRSSHYQWKVHRCNNRESNGQVLS